MHYLYKPGYVANFPKGISRARNLAPLFICLLHGFHFEVYMRDLSDTKMSVKSVHSVI